MYDNQLGRFNSIDPNADSYEITTPYNYAFNNPMLFVDPTGKDNIIYLLVAGNFSRNRAQDIANQANKYLRDLGLETRIQVFDSEENGEFDPTNLDDTDNYAVIGNNRKDIANLANSLNPDWISGYLETGTKPWTKQTNPETANTNNDYGGGLGILVDDVNNTSLHTKKKINSTEGSAFAIIHGAAHNSETIKHSKDDKGRDGHTQRGLMQRGQKVVDDLKAGVQVFSKPENQTYIKAIQERYGTNKAKSNYLKNFVNRKLKGKL